MNYLAHAFLSFEDRELMAGNMLGDFIKGNKLHVYPDGIAKGIRLHRFIDQYTDKHPLVAQACSRFRPGFLLSAPVFTDILFDHFLANDERYFNEHSLPEFTGRVYETLSQYRHLFDAKAGEFFYYMEKYNWLLHYRSLEGLSRSIHGICRRVPRLGDADVVMQRIYSAYDPLQRDYTEFFPQLMDACRTCYTSLKER